MNAASAPASAPALNANANAHAGHAGERGLMMVLHSAILALVLYLAMRFLAGQAPERAEDRSILLGAIALIYMLLFGHGLPRSISSRLL